jgi:ferredoxin
MIRETARIEKFISKQNLKKILKKLNKDNYLIAPTNAYNDIIFQEVGSVEDIVFDYENCLNSPKDYLLINDESLFIYDAKRLKIKNKKDSVFQKIVIFGSRACDIKAIELLDKFFSRNFEDPLYSSKRNNIFIITLVCQQLRDNCFCTSTNSGPYLRDGFDIQLVDINDGYFLETGSQEAKEFVGEFSNLMRDVNRDIRDKKESTVKKAIDSKKLDFNLRKVYSNLQKLDIEDEFWQDLSQRCQNCGGCLLICPTCSCFHVIDKKISDKEAQRVRSLDTCYYEGFTRMAGGYNPINPKNIMMKRKFYHKLWQQCLEFGMAGCTGCGRCNDICPGNINWLEIIKRIERLLYDK